MPTLTGQQLGEAPRYNHPCGHLLDSGRREEYINICVPLYRASSKGDLKAARAILEGHEYLVRYSITEKKETPLHVVAAVNNSEFVRYLVGMMSEDDLELQNEEGNNALCVAAITGNRITAMIMVQKNCQLLTVRGSGNMMPLYLAAYHYRYDTMLYLYEHSQRMSSLGWTDDDRNSVFLKCIEINCFDAEHANLGYYATARERREAARHLLLTEKSSKAATQLLRRIWKKIVKKNKDEIDIILRGPVAEMDTYPCQILFVAAETGNANFLFELIREYPDLIWKTDDAGRTIFHIGLSRHHHDIFNLLVYEIGAPNKDTITRLKDKHGNTLLHSVSSNTRKNPYEHLMGASAQLLHQQVWFQRVRFMLPPFCGQLKNAADQTPYEVFNHNHKDLIDKADKWVKETSNQSMLVATLITTISFTAAFTIPGGYNQNTGFPMFLRDIPFTAFVIFDAISFISSSLSILIFLPISFSRYSEHGSFHTKFAIGFLALLFSITTLMAAFSASFFVLYHNKLPIIMSSLATLPIIIFFLMESRSFTRDVLTISFEFMTPRSKKRMPYN
uniref:uncharacterized protein LOC122583777 n=1 Tax=Erigeron canadensis TaxID=72917 RepID=UPI001CB8AE83|nr:uncharacterized protein LOC122583777 [Erigeron canadensis]